MHKLCRTLERYCRCASWALLLNLTLWSEILVTDGILSKLLRLIKAYDKSNKTMAQCLLKFAPTFDHVVHPPLPSSNAVSIGLLVRSYKAIQGFRLEPTFMCLTSLTPMASCCPTSGTFLKWNARVRCPWGSKDCCSGTELV